MEPIWFKCDKTAINNLIYFTLIIVYYVFI